MEKRQPPRRMPSFPSTDECFICNQPIKFNDDGWEVGVSFGDARFGASRPSAFLWVHETCAQSAAHAAFPFPPTEAE